MPGKAAGRAQPHHGRHVRHAHRTHHGRGDHGRRSVWRSALGLEQEGHIVAQHVLRGRAPVQGDGCGARSSICLIPVGPLPPPPTPYRPSPEPPRPRSTAALTPHPLPSLPPHSAHRPPP